MEKVYKRTIGIKPDAVSGFCPGCMHGTIHKLIGEVSEELGMLEKLVRCEGVGCCGLGQLYVSHDLNISAHGRACAVATGLKENQPGITGLYISGRRRPGIHRTGRNRFCCKQRRKLYRYFRQQRNLRHDWRTDGADDFDRHEGYHCAKGQRSEGTRLSDPHVRSAEPADSSLLSRENFLQHAGQRSQDQSCHQKAFQYQMEGKGFSMVEIVTSCPTTGVSTKQRRWTS